jgi:hypothetical protein
MDVEQLKEYAVRDFENKEETSFFLQRTENTYLKLLIEMYKKENKEFREKIVKVSKSINKAKSKAKKDVSFYEHLKFVSEHHKIANEIKKELPKIFKQLKSK